MYCQGFSRSPQTLRQGVPKAEDTEDTQGGSLIQVTVLPFPAQSSRSAAIVKERRVVMVIALKGFAAWRPMDESEDRTMAS